MIGSIVLTLALVSSVVSMVMYFLSFRGYNNTLNIGRIAYHAMTMLVIIASTILLYSILTHDYSLKYVYSYSSNELPAGILAATFWAGQEGSFMLWLLLTAIVGLFLQSYSAKRGDLEPRVMAVFSFAITFLLIMVSPMFKNPFEAIWAEPIFINVKDIASAFFNMPWLQSFMFSDPQTSQNFVKVNSDLFAVLQANGIAMKDFVIDGRGLNPQLLNFWMQIHPPILFLGFSMATAPFAFAMAALMKNDYKDWVRQSMPWVLSGMGILGLGIMMGGYWAYEMLGWGGYWAWDPVENSSLIPWLIGVASIHTLLVQKKSQGKGGIGKFAKTNLILAILTYVLVLYSTFLTRSGVLGDASVHSFVDPGMFVYLFLVVFIGSFFLLGFGTIAYRWKYLNEQVQAEENILSRDLALFTATIVLCASALIVFVGTSAPLFGSSVETSFYDEMHIPIAIIIGLLNGLSLLLKWKHTEGKGLIRKSVVPVVLAILTTALVVIFGGVYDIMMILLTLSAAFSFFVNGEIALKIITGNWKMLGAYVAHIGIALFILGVVGSAAYTQHVDIDLEKNVPKEALGYELTFTDIKPFDNNTKYAFNINLKKGSSSYSVAPVMYISDFNQGLMREPAILTMITKDFYVSPVGYDPGKASNDGSNISLELGKTIEFNGALLTFKDFDFSQAARDAMMAGGDFEIAVLLNASLDDKSEDFKVALQNVNGQRGFTSYELPDMNIKVQLVNLDAAGKVQLTLSKMDGSTKSSVQAKEILTISASVKPFINLIWGGVLIMFTGFIISVVRRLKDSAAK
ncbi:MAG: cytochrome c biogenesis protein CcsA [Ignavibacteria bacterium]|nr:cytochrome c biogenesis protein CcsA [Ignavibacteria bacterium]